MSKNNNNYNYNTTDFICLFLCTLNAHWLCHTAHPCGRSPCICLPDSVWLSEIPVQSDEETEPKLGQSSPVGKISSREQVLLSPQRHYHLLPALYVNGCHASLPREGKMPQSGGLSSGFVARTFLFSIPHRRGQERHPQIKLASS
ncbi:Hypothetical predicted protein [Podarcis lilfordi]|uniref:Uncharacterized protein n=1 Tax=Podarcis lilfordi TaxID=74358 RepID=A0AA35LIW3_9SAUR|nr:Hypothetical predicted protein [Podarcis lilfordi]